MLKTCRTCGTEKAATAEFFTKAPRNPSGITSPCRECRKMGRSRSNRASYAANRAKGLLRAYRRGDFLAGRTTTITELELASVIERACHYCGTTDSPRGADRVNNDLGHTAGNVVPACRTCNMVRNKIFDVEEMKLLGAVIAQIMAARL